MAVFSIEEIINQESTNKENINLLKQAVRINEQEINQLEADVHQRRQRLNNEKIVIGGGIKSKDEKTAKRAKPKKINQVDVSMELELLSYCSDIQELDVFLPTIEDINYDAVMNCLLLEITKQIIYLKNEVRKGIISEQEALLQIQPLQKELSFLNDYQEQQLETSAGEIHIESPKLLYTTTPIGNICLLNDLKQISREAYPEFLTLFESIIHGNPKNVKTIDKSCKKFKNTFLEVKLNTSRMTFHTLSNNAFVLSGAFTKKVYTNSITGSKFRSIDSNFSRNKDFFLANLNNPEYLNSQEKITEEVYKILRKGK